MTGVLRRGEEIVIDSQKGHPGVRKADLGAMLLQTKNCLATPETKRKTWHTFSQSLQRECGPADALILDFKPPKQ